MEGVDVVVGRGSGRRPRPRRARPLGRLQRPEASDLEAELLAEDADALHGGRAVPLVSLGIPAEAERAQVRAVRVGRWAPGQEHGAVGEVGERVRSRSRGAR